MDWNIFKIAYFKKTSHPPSGARMQAMFYALELINFSDEKAIIENKWNEFLQVIGTFSDQDYHNALPDQFLRKSAEYTLEGLTALGCKLASENKEAMVIKTLNDAWNNFWQNPIGFPENEQEIMKELKANLSIEHFQ